MPIPKRNWDPVVGSVCVVFLDPDILDVKHPYHFVRKISAAGASMTVSPSFTMGALAQFSRV